MQKELFWRRTGLVRCLALTLMVVSPVLAATAPTPAPTGLDCHPAELVSGCVPEGTGTAIWCRAATPTPVAGALQPSGGHRPLTVRGYTDALTSDEAAHCMGMGRPESILVQIGSGQADGARVVAVGVNPAGDAMIGRAYGPGDADIVAGLAHHWADGTQSTNLDATYPFAPQYQADRVATPASSADVHLGSRTVTDICVRQPNGIVVTDHHIFHLDADPTTDVYAVQSSTRLIPGSQPWAGSGYVTVSTDVTHSWADGARPNTVVDFVQPGDPTVGPTTIFGTYHPSDRANLSYIYRQSDMTSVPCPDPAAPTVHWSSTADPTGSTPVITADELTPHSVATIRKGYRGPIATASVKSRFHTLPLQPGGIDLIDESAIDSTIAFRQEATP